MKIGLVLSQPPAYSETFFNAKIKGLQDKGFQVLLFVQSNPDNYKLCKVKTGAKWSTNPFKNLTTVILVCFKVFLNSKRIYKFVQLERKANRSWMQVFKNVFTNSHMLDANVNWLHFGFATLAIQSEHVAKAIGAKMAVSLRGFDIDVYPLKNPGCYKLLWQQVDKVHAISEYIWQCASELGLSKETEVQKITPAIEINNFKFNLVNKENSQIRMLTVARLHWIKGLTETLEALAILKQKGIHFKYTIIGSGDLYESLCFTIHQLNLTDSVCLVGKKSHEEVIKALHDTDLYLQYSHSEGFCNAVLEAQAAGVLCVVSDGGGLTENIKHLETGWVVPKRQPSALAETILKVLELPDNEKNKIRENARLRVENLFDLNSQINQFVQFYSVTN